MKQIKKNSKEQNKLKLRSSRMKALDQGMNFSSFGASSKNIFNFKIPSKDAIRRTHFHDYFYRVYWSSLPDVNCEKSAAYGCRVTNWEYLRWDTGDAAKSRYDYYNGSFIFAADPNVRIQIKYDEDFKINFENNFGVSYDVWSQKNGDQFDMKSLK